MFFLLLEGALLGLPAVIAPSPYKVYLISQSLKNGWRPTILLCALPPFLDAFIVGLVIFLVGISPDWLVAIIRLIGGIFMLLLVVKFVRLILSGQIGMKPDNNAGDQSITEAAGISLMNPNPYLISGMILGPIIAEAATITWLHGIIVYVGFYSVFFAGLCVLVVAFGTLGRINLKVSYSLMLIATIGLAGLGIYNLYTGGTEPWAFLP